MSFFLTDCEFYLTLSYSFTFFLVAVFARILWNSNDVPGTKLHYDESSVLLQKILKKSRCLVDNYVPTRVWGKSGHVQSVLHTMIGRFGGIPDNVGTRFQLTALDGSIISYDIFEPTNVDNAIQQELLIIVPGICNHAENSYIKAFTSYMTSQGFRIAVYNHTGALKTVELKQPRIFTYGNTSDLDQVVQKIIETENINKLIGLGFSLGGNILMKYLGEKPERQEHFHFATAICAGYDVPECNSFFQEWRSLRVLYNYGLTRNMLKIVKHHQPTLSKFCETSDPPVNLNWKRITSSKALHELDTEFTLKILNERDINEFYQDNSSSPYLDKVSIPLLLLNSRDDPMIPEEHHRYMMRLTEVNKNALFVVTPFGGHLGFFEGGYLFPNKLTWMDRMLCEFFKATLNVMKENVT